MRRFQKIFEYFQKVTEDRFENFPIFFDFSVTETSEDFRRLPKISENFKKCQNCWKVVLSTLRLFPKFFEDFRKLSMISEDLKKTKNTGRSVLALCDICKFFPKIS